MMLFRLVLFAFASTACLAQQAETANPPLKDLISQQWETLRVGLYYFGGDYSQDRPLLIFHRTGQGALLLAHENYREPLREHRCSLVELQAITNRLLGFFPPDELTPPKVRRDSITGRVVELHLAIDFGFRHIAFTRQIPFEALEPRGNIFADYRGFLDQLVRDGKLK